MRSSFANGAATTAAARNNATCVNVTSVMGGSVWAALGGATRAGKRCRARGYKANLGAVEVVNLAVRCEKGAPVRRRIDLLVFHMTHLGTRVVGPAQFEAHDRRSTAARLASMLAHGNACFEARA